VESGIRHRAEIDAFLGAGVDAFLIGEALVVHADPAFMLRGLV
jgi:indole-3-glycerol phosphate synthase